MMEEKEYFIKKVFNSIAHDYDKMNLILTGGFFPLWQKRLIKEFKAEDKDKVLDICCGSGTLTLKLAQELKDKKDGQITGLDFSEKMLEKACQKAKEKDLSVNFILGDALNLPFEDQSFNKLVNTFALRNLTSIERALSEMLRVLEKDGTLYILEVAKPENKLIRFFFEIYYYKMVPIIGRFSDKGLKIDGEYSPYQWLSQSLKTFPEKKDLKKTFLDLGFSQITLKNYGFGGISLFIAKK